MNRTLGLLLAAVLLGASCSQPGIVRKRVPYTAEVEETLRNAGENRSQLEAVLTHYRSLGDSLKLSAASFLIGNMGEKSFVGYTLRDSSGTEIDFDTLSYPDYEAMVATLDSIEAIRGTIDFVKDEPVYDRLTLRADDLIENIDLSFQAWREKPWAAHMKFEEFCEYVLPYRGSNEPLERWRKHFTEAIGDLEQQMQNPQDPVEAARLINEELKGWFTFDPRYYCHPTDQGLSEMLESGMGRCEDMTNLAIFAMRANGIAVTSDYTPFWADAGNNHAWNAVLDREGRAVMFMGCEAHPGEYRLSNRLAKVYRKTFAQQPENLAFRVTVDEQVPRWLAGKSYRDVTADYVDVSDVRVQLTVAAPERCHFAYLCVFNDGEWQAIAWGSIDDEEAVFHDIGRGVAYLPAYFAEDELIPAAPAFILHADGSVERLKPLEPAAVPLQLVSTTRPQKSMSTEATEKTNLEAGRRYELFYWDGRWESIGSKAAAEGALEFDQVPANALYWLVAEGSRREERVFTYRKGQQDWW
jgi:hypothetical protein